MTKTFEVDSFEIYKNEDFLDWKANLPDSQVWTTNVTVSDIWAVATASLLFMSNTSYTPTLSSSTDFVFTESTTPLEGTSSYPPNIGVIRNEIEEYVVHYSSSVNRGYAYFTLPCLLNAAN